MAGLGYKDFTVGQVLTSAEVDGYLMQQTIMVFASSAARTTALSGVLAEGMFSYLTDTNATQYYDGSAWVDISNPGDITAVTAGTGLSGGGTSGSVTLTNTMATAIDAKGDLIAGTAADTFSRLAVGTNGQVLQADSTAATGLSWATPAGGGGMTSIATGSLSGATTTISSISGSYKNLQLILTDFYPSTGTALQFTFNSIADYANVRIGNASTDGAIDNYAVSSGSVIYAGLNDVAPSDNNNTCVLDLFDYANTSNNKVGQSIASYYTNNTFYQTNLATFTAKSTGAITSINIKVASGTFSGGTYTLYGVS